MIVYPAIDLLEGQVVRLTEGDFKTSTVFSDQPEEIARRFESAGAQFLHVVDLSGARNPNQRQFQTLAKLIASTSLKVQVGGGIRTLDEVASFIASGADRVVIGSAVVKDPAMAKSALAEFGPERLTFALDVRVKNDRAEVMIQGWQEASGRELGDIIGEYLSLGLKRVLCTDIGLDGLMQGPNFSLYKRVAADFPEIEWQASGGVTTLADIHKLREQNLHSAIVGRALLSGSLPITEVFRHAR
jgi:phosphoribosylformimino-5-aminoimidazole carboxamide ribotide isomerase